jgi:hypothetical protein
MAKRRYYAFLRKLSPQPAIEQWLPLMRDRIENIIINFFSRPAWSTT